MWQLEHAERLRGGAAERESDRIVDAIRRLPRRGIFAAIDAAIAADRRRRRWIPDLVGAGRLGERPDAPEWIEQQVRSLPRTPARDLLSFLPPLEAYAPLANRILASGRTHPLFLEALRLAGSIASPTSAPHVRKLLRSRKLPEPVRRQLFTSARRFGLPEARRMYEPVLRDAQELRTRIDAAWGLGKLGDAEAIAYLVALLDDRGGWEASEWGGRVMKPGHWRWAAEALCDIHGWPFSWNGASVARVKRWLAEADRKRLKAGAPRTPPARPQRRGSRRM